MQGLRFNINDIGGAYRISDAHTPNMKQQPRVTTKALTDTLVTRADGTQYIIPRNTRSAKLSDNRKREKIITQIREHRITAADLAPIGGQYD